MTTGELWVLMAPTLIGFLKFVGTVVLVAAPVWMLPLILYYPFHWWLTLEQERKCEQEMRTIAYVSVLDRRGR